MIDDVRIDDVSRTLSDLLTHGPMAPDLARARIAFERPGDNFTPSQTTLDLFLYDIRENLELRNAEPTLQRLGNGRAIRSPAPMRLACTYLITAWAIGGSETALQEQRLLGNALRIFARNPTIPDEFLPESLKGQQPPLPLVTARSDWLKDPHEFWTAIGGRLRPSLTVTVTVGFDVFEKQEVQVVTAGRLRIADRGAADAAACEPPLRIGIGGRVLDAHGGSVAGAEVWLDGGRLAMRTDAEGRYAGLLHPGTYTLRARSRGHEGRLTVTVLDKPPPLDEPRLDRNDIHLSS